MPRLAPPLVVLIHGGAFFMGDKADCERERARLPGAGFAVASVNYRFSDQAIWPAQLDDLKSAFAFLRAHAGEYGYDGQRMASFGPSAGGHLSASIGIALAADPAKALDASVVWFPPVDFPSMDADIIATGVARATGRNDGQDSPESRLIGAHVATHSDLARAAGPIARLAELPRDARLPDILIMHGALDPYIAAAQTLSLRRLVTADWSSALAALIVVLVVVGVFHPNFLAPGQLINVLQSAVYAALIAAGLVFLIPQNEIDLSVGGNYVLTGIVAALLMRAGYVPILAIPMALSVSVVIGLLNALTSQVIGIPSLIGTLAMSWMLRGLALALSNGTQVTGVPLQDPIIWYLGGGKVLGLPVSVVLLIVVGIVLALVMHKTPFGYRIREIGSNPDAAAFSGIPIRATRTWGFVVAGLMAGLSGIVALAFFTVGDPQSGGGIELFAVAGAVIGGTPLAGGKATVFGAILGSVLLTAVAIGLVYFQIPATWAQFATGAVILGAVSVDGLVQRQKRLKGGH